MDYTNKVFDLDNGKSYLVIEQVDYDNKIYLYIVNSNNESDTKFVELIDGNLIPIESTLFDNTIFPLFMDKLKK